MLNHKDDNFRLSTSDNLNKRRLKTMKCPKCKTQIKSHNDIILTAKKTVYFKPYIEDGKVLVDEIAEDDKYTDRKVLCGNCRAKLDITDEQLKSIVKNKG